MKKFIKFKGRLFTMAILLTFTACTGAGQEENTGPGVEIVQRSRLLDRITMDHILPSRQREKLADAGLRADFKNLTMTGENTADFDLVLSDGSGEYAVTLPAFLTYNRHSENGKDVFTDIRLWWGSVTLSQDKTTALVIGADKVHKLNTDDVTQSHRISIPLADGEKITVMAAKSRGDTALIYKKGEKDYLQLTDKEGNTKVLMALAETGTLTQPSADGIMPFDTDNLPVIDINGTNTFVAGSGTAYFYNSTDDMLLTGHSVSKSDKESGSAALYVMDKNPVGGGGKIRDYLLAVNNARDDSRFMLINNRLFGDSTNPKEISLSSTGRATVKCPAVGVELDLDFAGGKVSALRQKIPREALDSRLYICRNMDHGIYDFAPETVEGITTYNIALKEEDTGKIGYLGSAGLINNAYPGETGFLANGDIYLLGNDNLKIFTVNVDDTTPVLSLADKFPLGENIDENLTDRIIVSAVRNEKTGEIAVAYYDFIREKGNENHLDGDIIRLKATYRLAFFDKDGNLQNSYDTGVNAYTGYHPVTLVWKNNKVNMYITYKGTADVMTKGSFDTATELFTVSE